MILFINACVRENSRTLRLAEYLITKLADQSFLDRRDALIAAVKQYFEQVNMPGRRQ